MKINRIDIMNESQRLMDNLYGNASRACSLDATTSEIIHSLIWGISVRPKNPHVAT